MYAVLHVVNFSLQAVWRTDPTLASRLPGSEEEGAGEVSSSPSVGEVSPPRFSVAQHASSNTSFVSLNAGVSVAGKNIQVARASSAKIQRELSLFPLAIVSGDAKKSLILQVSDALRAKHVEIGMTAPQAQARCAEIVLRQRSTAAEAEAQRAILACALSVAPQVEETSAGVCTIEVSGLPLENRSRALANAVCQLRELGLIATGGIGRTPLLALYAARETTSVRTVENAPAFLHPLPLAVAETSAALTAILTSWGITTLGQLTALPKPEVARRLGADGVALWDRARGGDTRPLKSFIPAAEFSASLELEYEVETAEAVLFILRRFVDRLALELRTAAQVASELSLTLFLADEKTHQRSFRLPEPTAREDVLFRTLHTHLESLHTDSCVVGVALQVTPVRPLARQPGLFETGLRDPHGFAETLARVSAVVGSDRLGTPELQDTYRPDAVKLITPPQLVPAAQPSPIWPATGLPLRRFRPPLPARVEVATGGRPAFFSSDQIHSPIAGLRGPWKSSGEWWKPESWAREEWDIELAVGGLYRVAKEGDAWYLDGEYE